MNSITLSVRNGQYVARFEGPHSYQVIGALGSPDLPLAFAANTPLGEVAEHMAGANPGSIIISALRA